MSLSLFRFDQPLARLWAFAQMGLARRSLSRVPGIGFWKLFGTGTGEGFTPIPNTAVYAIMATWDSHADARAAIDGAPVFARYRARAAQDWTLYLAPTSVRGRWSGQSPFTAAPDDGGAALAALTRATVRPRAALRFWQRVPSISAAIGADPSVMFKVGLGEVPWFQQVTFSIWPDADAMAAFARHDGPHAHAIRAVREGGWFAEELYARFRVVDQSGTWEEAPRTAALLHGTTPKASTA